MFRNIHQEQTKCGVYSTDKVRYTPRLISSVTIAYIVVLILWLVIIAHFSMLGEADIVTIFILLIPVIAMGVSYWNLEKCTFASAQDMFKSNIIALVLLISTILISWDRDLNPIKDKRKFFEIVIFGVLLLMLTMIDIWGDSNFLVLASHTRTAIQAIVIAMFAFALYTYYLNLCEKKIDD